MVVQVLSIQLPLPTSTAFCFLNYCGVYCIFVQYFDSVGMVLHWNCKPLISKTFMYPRSIRGSNFFLYTIHQVVTQHYHLLANSFHYNTQQSFFLDAQQRHGVATSRNITRFDCLPWIEKKNKKTKKSHPFILWRVISSQSSKIWWRFESTKKKIDFTQLYIFLSGYTK